MVKKNSEIEALNLINEKNALKINKLKDKIKTLNQKNKEEERKFNWNLVALEGSNSKLKTEINILVDNNNHINKQLKNLEFNSILLDQYRKDVELFQKRDKIYIDSEFKVKEYDSMLAKFNKEINTMNVAYKELESYVDKCQLEQFYQSKVCIESQQKT